MQLRLHDVPNIRKVLLFTKPINQTSMEKKTNEMVFIQSRLNAPKKQRNTYGNYNYRSCEDILEAVKPLLAEMECVLTIHDEIVQVADRIYVKATATLTTSTGKEYTTTAFAREAETKKGMDESQITGSASSYARKYALNGLFCIDDNKDSDFTNQTPKEERKPDETRSQASDFPFCQDCGARIDERVRKYSVDKFGVALCRDCQKRRA